MRDIVILSHADQPDYGDLDGRIEGVTIFAPSGIFDDLSPLHDICNQFVNVKSTSPILVVEGASCEAHAAHQRIARLPMPGQ